MGIPKHSLFESRRPSFNFIHSPHFSFHTPPPKRMYGHSRGPQKTKLLWLMTTKLAAASGLAQFPPSQHTSVESPKEKVLSKSRIRTNNFFDSFPDDAATTHWKGCSKWLMAKLLAYLAKMIEKKRNWYYSILLFYLVEKAWRKPLLIATSTTLVCFFILSLKRDAKVTPKLPLHWVYQVGKPLLLTDFVIERTTITWIEMR